MKKIRVKNKKTKKKIEEFLKLDTAVNMQNGLRIEMFNNSEMLIEGYQNLSEYSEDYVIIGCKKGSFTVFGNGLKLENMTDGSVTVKGNIVSLEFCLGG